MLNKSARSLCDTCYKEVAATIFAEKDGVYIEKLCPAHGRFRAIVENDHEFYDLFSRTKPLSGKRFSVLIIPVTFRCNMHCSFCYAPYQDQDDMDIEDIERVVQRFEGAGIFLSGGEPTVRNDLLEIVETVTRYKELCGIVTNGLKLADPEYLSALHSAGLKVVFFSFDSFREGTYKHIKKTKNRADDILASKLKALENLKNENLLTILSATIYQGLNDDEMEDLFLFAMRNRGFIKQLRFRSCVNLGRHTEVKEYFTSELLKKFCGQLGLDRKRLLEDHLTGDEHTIHHVMFDIRGAIVDGRFFPTYEKGRRNWGLFGKIVFLVRLALANRLEALYKAVKERPFFRMQAVRFIHWPTVHNVDLGQIDREVAHLYGRDKILNFCHTIILYGRDNTQVQ